MQITKKKRVKPDVASHLLFVCYYENVTIRFGHLDEVTSYAGFASRAAD